MKKIAILFLGFFTIINISSAQTELETIDYLNTKLTAHGPIYFGIKFSYIVSTPIDSLTNKKVVQIELIDEDLTGDHIKVLPEHVSSIETFRDEQGYLTLKIISPNRLISFFSHGKETTFQREYEVILETTDEEVLKIKKALEHLFKINGAALIDDNLFKD